MNTGLNPIIFLDRDGTLIEERDYLSDPAQVVLLPGVIASLVRLKQKGVLLTVISNQSGVARGYMSREQVEAVNTRFLTLLRDQGVVLDGIYWCPHSPDEGCDCRKPALGLIKQAAKDLGPWRRTFSVGDRWSDIALGQRTGGLGILVRTGYGEQFDPTLHAEKPDFIARDIIEAADWMIRQLEKETVHG